MGLKEKRLDELNNLIDQAGYMTTNEIATTLQVSTMTVRRDLQQLEEEGRITRIYGGAQSKKQVEFTTNEKLQKNITLKKKIALQLNKLIEPNSTIYLGAGTTLLMAVSLLAKKNLTFVTNSLPAFNEIFKTNCRVFLTGGEMHRNTDEFLGKKAENIFKGINLDYALCSTNGINNNHVTTRTLSEGSMQNVAMNHADKTIIASDHTKFNHSDIITFQSLSSFDYLVTDDEISDSDLKKYSQYSEILY